MGPTGSYSCCGPMKSVPSCDSGWVLTWHLLLSRSHESPVPRWVNAQIAVGGGQYHSPLSPRDDMFIDLETTPLMTLLKRMRLTSTPAGRLSAASVTLHGTRPWHLPECLPRFARSEREAPPRKGVASRTERLTTSIRSTPSSD
jgi:hypothetical protein